MAYTGSEHEASQVRAAAELTTSYVASDLKESTGYTQLVVNILLTLGSLTTAELKVEFSENGTDFYQETFELADFAAGKSEVKVNEYEFSVSGNFRLFIPIKDRKIRISVKGTGDETGSSMAVDCVLGTN